MDTAEAAISMRQAEITNAQAQLIGFDDIPLFAPTNGRILRIIQQSETSLSAGTPIIKIGDISNNLEVLVDLLSTDAVQVAPRDPVLITDWGGVANLIGRVTCVDIFGIAQILALALRSRAQTRTRLSPARQKTTQA